MWLQSYNGSFLNLEVRTPHGVVYHSELIALDFLNFDIYFGILKLYFQLLQKLICFQMITCAFEFSELWTNTVTNRVLLDWLNRANLEKIQIDNKKRLNLEAWGFHTNITKPLMFYLMTSLFEASFSDLWTCLKHLCKYIFQLPGQSKITANSSSYKTCVFSYLLLLFYH